MPGLNRIFIVLAIALVSLPAVASLAQDARAAGLIRQMIDSARALRGFTSVIRKTERIEGELILQVSKVKVSRNPYEVYVKQLAPKAGVEILCADGCRKALINMNGFPWINLTLDPDGTTMRRRQHHTVHDSGFDLLADILERSLNEFNPQNQVLTRGADVTWQGEEAYQISMENRGYHTRKYTVSAQENIADIAGRFNVNEYAILELNPQCDNYEDVRAGQELLIPSHYGVKMTLFINKKTLLPLLIRVYDNRGLFEEYDYTQFVLNPEFAANEFDESFAEYDF